MGLKHLHFLMKLWSFAVQPFVCAFCVCVSGRSPVLFQFGTPRACENGSWQLHGGWRVGGLRLTTGHFVSFAVSLSHLLLLQVLSCVDVE
jgi:hypothetical protein